MLDRPIDRAIPQHRHMSGFAPLFKKEVRFFAAPAIVFFLFVHLPVRIGLYLLNFRFSHFYRRTVIDHLDETTLMNTYIWNPILHGDVLSFMYTALLLFVLIHGQNSHSKIQSDMLPVRRMTHLIATFCAFSFWVMLFHIFMPIVYKTLFLTIIRYEQLLMFPYLGLLIGEMSYACNTLSVAATALLGFTVAVILKAPWWRYVAGMTVGLIGYVVLTEYVTYFSKNIEFGVVIPGATRMSIDLSASLLPEAIIIPLFVIASMLLYERFGEV